MKEEKITDVGSEILDVASGIKQIMQTWDQDPRAGGAGRTGEQSTGNDRLRVEQLVFGSEAGHGGSSGGEKGYDGPLVTARALADSGSGSTNPSGVGNDWRLRDVTVPAWMTAGDVSPVCLPRGSDWGFCSSGGRASSTFTVPNFLNHTSAEEVGATLGDWAGLLSSRCHRDVERFFCLLLAPACPGSGALPSPSPPPLLPCRSLCAILTDACWGALGGRELPVTCDSLPEGLPHQHPCQPVSSCRCAGNAAG